MVSVKRLVVDVLTPHDPPLAEFTADLADVGSLEGVTGSLIELDAEVQNVKLTVAGPGVGVEEIESEIETLGGTVHSVDQVACGDRVVEDRPTPQDR